MKKQQHYIWKHYLSSWTCDKKIWCKRKGKGKCFHTSLKNVGQKRFFYKAKQLNQFEQTIVENFIHAMPPSTYELSLSTLNIYDLSSKGDDFTQKNTLEEYHTSIEHTAINIISLLLKEDMSWLKDEQSKINFSRFLGTQYTRTNRNHSILSGNLSSLPKRKEQLNPEKLAKVFTLLMGDSIGNWIYSLGQFTLIKNNTSLDFITGDQPVFNFDMNDAKELEPPKDFKLYYPLAPNLALLVSKEIQINKEVSIKEVEEYNDFIVLSSYEQIYSQQKESLAKYDK